MSKRASPKLIGVFVVGAVVLIVTAIVVLGSGKLFAKTEKLISWFDDSVGGLEEGAPVKFRGVQIGQVTDVLLRIPEADPSSSDFRMPVVYELDYRRMARRGETGGDISRAELDDLINQGMRATLATESFVTGLKYIELDMYPGTPINLENVPGLPYPEIPTIRTGLEQIQTKAEELIATVSAVNFDSLVKAITGSVEGVRNFVQSEGVQQFADSLLVTMREVNETMASFRDLAIGLDTTIAPLREAIEDVSEDAQMAARHTEELIGDLRGKLEPGAPLTVKLEQALTEIAAAARSLAVLTDYLERNPSAILRGKPKED